MASPAQHGVQPGSTKGLLIWYQIDKRTFADMLVCKKKNLLMGCFCLREFMVVVWDEELATGHEEIDKQHKELFRRFNDFQTACKDGKGLDELSSLLDFLGQYVRSHFFSEEVVQIIYEYPDYQKHKEEHDDFIRKFRKLEDQLNTQGVTPALLIQTNMILVDWLTRHFAWADKNLASFLHKAMPKQ